MLTGEYLPPVHAFVRMLPEEIIKSLRGDPCWFKATGGPKLIAVILPSHHPSKTFLYSSNAEG